MNFVFLKGFISKIVTHFVKNGSTYGKVLGGMVFASAVSVAACHKAHKKLEKKHREEDAKKYQEEFDRRLNILEDRYQHNEYLLKKKINELCDEFGIEHVC